jgi:hypothetical protein
VPPFGDTQTKYIKDGTQNMKGIRTTVNNETKPLLSAQDQGKVTEPETLPQSYVHKLCNKISKYVLIHEKVIYLV